jgi:hypothetical protein
MIAVRVKWRQLGGHVHCRIYTAALSGPTRGQTFGLAGELVFREDEWIDAAWWLTHSPIARAFGRGAVVELLADTGDVHASTAP